MNSLKQFYIMCILVGIVSHICVVVLLIHAEVSPFLVIVLMLTNNYGCFAYRDYKHEFN